MPLYEYECVSCGEKFEIRQSTWDTTEKVKCPKCQSENTKKVLSSPAKSPSGGSYYPRVFG